MSNMSLGVVKGAVIGFMLARHELTKDAIKEGIESASDANMKDKAATVAVSIVFTHIMALPFFRRLKDLKSWPLYERTIKTAITKAVIEAMEHYA